MSKSKFQVGDLVIGNKTAGIKYASSGEGWIGEVLKIDPSTGNFYAQGRRGSKHGPWGDLEEEAFDLLKKANDTSGMDPQYLLVFREGESVIVKEFATIVDAKEFIELDLPHARDLDKKSMKLYDISKVRQIEFSFDVKTNI